MIPREILKRIRQIELRTRRLVSDVVAGAYHSVFKGRGIEFDEVRQYVPGDDVRSIDWNVTARMNHPYVKKYVEERELTLLIMADVSASGIFGSGERSKRDLAAEIASVLAFSALKNKDKVGLLLFAARPEKYIPPRKGNRHVLRIIREVLFYSPDGNGTNFAAALEFVLRVLRRRGIVVLISDFVESDLAPGTALDSGLKPETWRWLRQVARKHDLVAVRITDPHEIELPDAGRIALEDPETGTPLVVNTRVAGIRRAYAERAALLQRRIAAGFATAGIDHIEVRTDRPYLVQLRNFFRMREKRRLHG